MKVLFIILLVIIIILIVPIQLKIHFKYDVLRNRGFFELKLWIFNLKFYRFKFKNGQILLKNRKETKQIDIEINMENVDYVNELQKQLFRRLYLKYFKVFLTIGSDKNASGVAMLGGVANTLLAVLKAYVKTHKPTSDFAYRVYPQFDQSNGVVTLRTSFSISITNILISLIRAKIILNKKKEQKNERKRVQASN